MRTRTFLPIPTLNTVREINFDKSPTHIVLSHSDRAKYVPIITTTTDPLTINISGLHENLVTVTVGEILPPLRL